VELVRCRAIIYDRPSLNKEIAFYDVDPIPGTGAYARIADTEGNVLGLFESQ